jgi:hypothetical protein
MKEWCDMSLKLRFLAIFLCLGAIGMSETRAEAATCNAAASAAPIYFGNIIWGVRFSHGYSAYADNNEAIAKYGWIIGNGTIPLDHTHVANGSTWQEADIPHSNRYAIFWNQISVMIGNTVYAHHENHASL